MSGWEERTRVKREKKKICLIGFNQDKLTQNEEMSNVSGERREEKREERTENRGEERRTEMESGCELETGDGTSVVIRVK